jgi:hypothetical protein
MDHRVDYLFDWINKTAKGDLFNDKTPPKVNILSPQEGASVGSTVTIDVSATDNTLISLVKVFIDGTPVFQSQKLSFSHQATDLINGTHTIRVEAVDQYKNVGSTAVQVQVTDGLVNGDQNGGQFGGQNHQPPKADDQPFVIKGSCSLGAPGPDLSLLLLCLLPLLRTMRRARRQRP